MKCRVGDVIGFNLGAPSTNCGEKLRHFWISSTVVNLGILCLVPQADSERFPATLGDERDFVLESFLFSKQGKDVLFQPLGELRNAIGFRCM